MSIHKISKQREQEATERMAADVEKRRRDNWPTIDLSQVTEQDAEAVEREAAPPTPHPAQTAEALEAEGEARVEEVWKIVEAWQTAALRHYPQGWDFDPTNPELTIANIVAGARREKEAK